ncbi:MAG: RsmB/NOP family class I SAM-dependent RNA methyltransferase [Myxococcaceae bacterium]|nr:RsmB/NOP family class I SAM-dependent RNA methyltransferase [Myxococcaceae bacterium]
MPTQKRPVPFKKPSGVPNRKSKGRGLREDLITQTCLEAYGSIRHEGRLADRAIDFSLRRKAHLYSAERREIAERVYALLRHQIHVDYLLENFWAGYERRSTSQKDLLRLAVARVLSGESAQTAGLELSLLDDDVALLAHVTADRGWLEKMPLAERLSIEGSVPHFLAERLVRELGPDASALATAFNTRAPLTVRANALKGDRDALAASVEKEDVRTRPTPYSPLGLHLDTRINAFSLQAFRDGAFEIQDEGSQLLGMLVDAPPRRVIDACAGAGGKTLQLAAQMKNRGELFALDIEQRRLDDLKKRARRAGAHNVRIRLLPADAGALAQTLQDLQGSAERVLVDAPCSGTGTFRRKPDARYRLTEAMLAEHVTRQGVLLRRFAALVKPGGRLIYGTCSVLREENEAVIEAFVAEHPDFEVVSAAQWLPADAAKTVLQGPFLRLYPHRHGTDGFFGAVLVKKKPTA